MISILIHWIDKKLIEKKVKQTQSALFIKWTIQRGLFQRFLSQRQRLKMIVSSIDLDLLISKLYWFNSPKQKYNA